MDHRVIGMSRDIQIFQDGKLRETRSLADGTYRLGRDPSSDILLADAAVSKTHATLTIEQGTFIIKDAGSANGIFHQGKKIAEQTFQNTLDIEIKPFTLRITDASRPKPEKGNQAGGFLNRIQIISLANIKASSFALVFAIMLFTLIAGYLPLKKQATGFQREEVLKTGILLARYLGEINRPFLADRTSAMVRVTPVNAEDGVIYAVVVDADGRIIAPKEKQGDFFDWEALAQAFKEGKLTIGEGAQNEKIIFYPVRQQTQTLGAAIVGFAGLPAAGETIGMGGMGYFLLTILFCLSILVSYLMTKAFLNPLIALNEHVEVAIKEGRAALDFKAPYKELDHLKRAFDRLLMRKPPSAPIPEENNHPSTERIPASASPAPDMGLHQKSESIGSSPPQMNELKSPWCVIDRETYTLRRISDNFGQLPGSPDRKAGMHLIEAFDADMIQAVSQLMEAKNEEMLTVVQGEKTYTLRRIENPAEKNNVTLVFEDNIS
ncbi:MAG: FHA domain-containing protein [Desulfobacteraceae bacterium]|nr:MAG: FHA domain-containing protein [Desulfobacteraceae bacterium]